MLKKKIKVLVVDDSALVRDVLSKALSKDPMIEVVGSAQDVYVARDKIVLLKPDVITLDIEMPGMDGIEFLRRLMPQYPIPVVIVSSLAGHGQKITFDALEAGAVDFVSKPSLNIEKNLSDLISELCTKIKIASTANLTHWKTKRTLVEEKKQKSNYIFDSTDKIIAIGASTGGTEALKKIVNKLPMNFPGVVIVQHMPPVFTKLFAETLNKTAMMEVKEAENNERVSAGKILIAPGNLQTTLVRSGGIYKVICEKGEKVNGHCPSVDVFMNSVAQNAGKNAYGVLLTGMGSDGAKGMLEMKKAGSFNIAQDKETSIVFGMPKVAIELGGVDKILPIDEIASQLINLIRKKI